MIQDSDPKYEKMANLPKLLWLEPTWENFKLAGRIIALRIRVFFIQVRYSMFLREWLSVEQCRNLQKEIRRLNDD